ncbi:hypothetical protein HJD18_12330 [Thermoleophilia bacterium SCSIO 60948]|nr:hypothetical protein HJD18_12330 [Thermoleophilia bacterium SCSIO 60948]
MSRLLLTGLLALFAVLAVALPAEARPKPKKPTTVEAAVNFPFVEGRVKGVQTCRARRTVKLFENGAEGPKIDTTKTNAAGDFMFSSFASPLTEYRVVAPRKVTRRLVCRKGESGPIQGSPIR